MGAAQESRVPPLRFGVLGPVAAWCGEHEIPLGSGKQRLLLAVLLLRVNERVDRDLIIDGLWATAAPSSAVNLVQKYVGDLRRAFGGSAALRSVPGGYRLDAAGDELDSTHFATLVTAGRARRAAGDAAGAQRCLRQALALWRGPAFDGVDLGSADVQRARLGDLRLGVQEDVAELALDRGEHELVAAELAGLVREHPFRERLRELLMVALYRQGRRAEALEAFTAARVLLAEELGIEPGPGLRRCYEDVLRGDVALQRPDERGAGSWPLHGQDPAVPIRQLPLDVADFVGRTAALAEITELLTAPVARDAGAPPVVVVTGGPGVGKSSLAVHVGHAVAAAFPDGQLYLELAGTSAEPRDPVHLLAEVLHAFAVTGQALPDSLAERAGLYRSLLAGRRVLVVLDDAGRAEQVVPLLPATATCAVLITGRNLLGDLPGARRVDLDVLQPPEARELFTELVGAPRIEAEPTEADAVLACCANLPLAIRIAGARLATRPTWPLRVLAERLRDESRRLSELAVGELGVRASVRLSLALLPEDAVRALCLLGLLGPHTLPGWVIGALLEHANADEVLDCLVDASLLRLTSTDSSGQPRYRLHDLIRAHAVERAESIPYAQRRAAMNRVLGAWLVLTEHANDRLPVSLFRHPHGPALRWPLPADLIEGLVADAAGWFDAERQNLLGAIGLAVRWDLADAAWELASGTVAYDDMHCRYRAWLDGHRLALGAVRAAGARNGEAVLLRGIAQVSIYRDELDEAVELLRRAETLSRDVGDTSGEALTLAMLGSVSRVRGRYDEALRHVHRALDMVVAEGELHLQAQLRGAIGAMLMARGRLTEAHEWFQQALRQARSLGDWHREAVLLRRLGPLHDRRGAPRQALSCLSRALRSFESYADEQCAANTLLEIGRVHAGQDDHAQGAPALQRAAELFHRHGDQSDEAECWQLLGELTNRADSAEDARGHLGHALRLWRAVGDAQRVTQVTDLLGTVAY